MEAQDPPLDDVLEAPTEGPPHDSDHQAGDAIDEGGCGEHEPSPSAIHAAQVGDTIGGQYELLEEVARGGMGVVYRARQIELDRIVAVKMILASQACEATLARFSAESQATAALDHPNIVPVYDSGAHAGRPFFVMAFVHGPSLASIIQKQPLTPFRAATIARDVARALHHAHTHRVIHRDVKPANILIAPDGAPRVTDFGVCKFMDQAAGMTSQGEVVGTPHFMPPEQTGVDVEIGPTADVYSIGAVLYAMVTGRPPFQAASPIDVVAQVLQNPPVPLTQWNQQIPVDLECITLKCLEKQPSRRYATAAALADDLQRFLDHEPIHAKPPGIVQRLAYLLRKHVLFASVSGAAALTLVALTLFLVAALLRTRTQLDAAQQQLTHEREIAVAFAQRLDSVDKGRELPVQAIYDVERLTKTATNLAVTRPDVALQLALESLRIAEDQGLPQVLCRADGARNLVEDAVRSRMGRLDASAIPAPELISLGERCVQTPLMRHERMIFGLSSTYESDHKAEQASTE